MLKTLLVVDGGNTAVPLTVRPLPSFNRTAPVGWVTCYPPMVLTSDDGPVRNELRTLRSLQPDRTRRVGNLLPTNGF
jgi:hypothetical protein